MTNSTQAYHLISVKDRQGERTYTLNVATVSIGRDPSNGIIVYNPEVSRHHAMLIRIPAQDADYAYEIIDGDFEGFRSQNGVFVNQVACQRKVLVSGDNIKLGEATLYYIVATMTPQEFLQYFNARQLEYRSIKQDVQNSVGTVAHKSKFPSQ